MSLCGSAVGECVCCDVLNSEHLCLDTGSSHVGDPPLLSLALECTRLEKDHVMAMLSPLLSLGAIVCTTNLGSNSSHTKKTLGKSIRAFSHGFLPGCFRARCAAVPKWIVLSVYCHIVSPEALKKKLNHRLFCVLFYELKNRVPIFKGKRHIPSV